jgi:hypothetical protein
MVRRLISDWVHGGLLYGILLLLCTPVPGRDWPSSILTIFLRFILREGTHGPFLDSHLT